MTIVFNTVYSCSCGRYREIGILESLRPGSIPPRSATTFAGEAALTFWVTSLLLQCVLTKGWCGEHTNPTAALTGNTALPVTPLGGPGTDADTHEQLEDPRDPRGGNLPPSRHADLVLQLWALQNTGNLESWTPGRCQKRVSKLDLTSKRGLWTQHTSPSVTKTMLC